MNTEWNAWVDQLPQEQAKVLANVLIEKNFAAPLNGHNTKQDQQSDEVRLIRLPAKDFIDNDVPPYVDVHNLIDLYNKIAYKENLLLKGPKGDGKSLSFVHFAGQTQTPLITINCSEETKDKNLVGNYILRPTGIGTMESPWVLGGMVTAIEVANEYGRAILAFEEINALTPQVQKQLNALLDFRKKVVVNQLGRSFSLRENAYLWVVATMNPSVYGGTYEINEDLRSRWVECEIDYPNRQQEKKIIDANVPFDPSASPLQANNPAQAKIDWDGLVEQTIKFANETRTGSTQYALSSRDVVRLLRNIISLGLKDALQLMVCKFEGDDRKTVISRVTSHFKGMHPKESWGK